MEFNRKSLLFTSTKEMIDISSCLFESTHISYFEYVQLYNDGSVIKLDTREGVIEFILKNDLYLKPGDLSDFNKYMFMSLNIPFSKMNNYHKSLDYYKDNFGIEDFFFISEKFENYIESFVFGSKSGNVDMIQFYLNNIHLLYKFIFYFRDAAKDLIKRARKDRIVLPEWNGFFLNQKNDASEDDKRIEMKVKPKNMHLKTKDGFSQLSHREFTCLNMYMKGIPNKIIADKLSISIRTVENHIINIKNKLNCRRKNDLIDVLNLNNLMKFTFE